MKKKSDFLKLNWFLIKSVSPFPGNLTIPGTQSSFIPKPQTAFSPFPEANVNQQQQQPLKEMTFSDIHMQKRK